MENKNISFIGGGNMATSLIGGLIANGITPNRIYVSDNNEEQLAKLTESFGIEKVASNADAVDKADLLIFAVKPQVIGAVAKELKTVVQNKKPLILSLVAGLPQKDLARWLGGNVAIVRTMSNTPAMVQSAATAMFANETVSDEQCNLAEFIMRSVGLCIWLNNESELDIVTALSGSGPAYFFLVMEVLEKAAVEIGLSPENAHLLTLQTAFGAAKMSLESDSDAVTLRKRVTSPGGTTEQAIKVLEEGKIQELFNSAVKAAHLRSTEIATHLGRE